MPTKEQQKAYQPSDRARQHLRFDEAEYREMYRRSIEEPQAFYAEQAREHLSWTKDFSEVCGGDFAAGTSTWFADGELNACYNCVDRHLAELSEQTAILWVGDQPGVSERISYAELHREVCLFANVLKAKGVKKGDRVCIYMPMIPHAAYAMLACARIGAIHSVVFGGFSPNALRDRIEDAGASCVITADEGVRGGRKVPLKANVDKAIAGVQSVASVIVIQYTGEDVTWTLNRDCWYHEEASNVPQTCDAEPMSAEDPLFILYTSGSTGKPKGVLHTTGGYLLHAAMTFDYIFNCRRDEIFWCTADVGWITGHSYSVYAPLAKGITTLMFEGVPNWPDASRCWQIVEEHGVSVFYTAPTAIRALMALGDGPVQKHSRDSLRLLGTVGEPINPEAWEWYYHKVGNGQCPVVDTWWQTETGGIMISPCPGITPLKPGSATLPFFGVRPVLLDAEGAEIAGEGSGRLALAQSWPGQIRTVYGEHQRMVDTYFAPVGGYYMTGDGARRDEDGYYWITGRVDDVINVSGHRLGTAEVESALVLHEAVAEAAVVGCPHEIKGEAIYAFVTLMKSVSPSEELRQELRQFVAQSISAVARPDTIQWAPDLPKTRSGKIMRRILRRIAAGETEGMGDTSTLADPLVVESLKEGYKELS